MKRKQGVSLIVLVITIIVMVILAGAIIITLNNSGVIQKASEAVRDTDEATVKELAQLAWAEAYAGGVRTVEGEDGFQARIEEALEKNNIDPEKYLLNVTTNGVTAKLLDKAWVKEGFTVVRGEDVLEIGDTVAYDETAGGTKTGLTATEWKVLGADADGNLLLMSTTDIKTGHRLGYESTMADAAVKLAESQKDWLNGAAELDSICEAYGYGEGVVGKARSITVEDVNTATGYDKKVETKEFSTYEYKYNETTTPTYEYKSGNQIYSKTLDKEHTNGFYYYNGNEFIHITDLTTGTNGAVFATLTTNYYNYQVKNIKANEKVIDMIFGKYNESNSSYANKFWLASSTVGSPSAGRRCSI